MKVLVASGVVAAILAGCQQAPNPTGPGAVSVGLSADVTDPTPDHGSETVTSVMVSVAEVRAHTEALGWVVLSDAPVLLDLLALPAAGAPLGYARLPAGHVTQIRLILAEAGHLVVTNGGEAPLDVPSGSESGIKIQGPWEIADCNETIIALEFQGEENWVHPTGGGERWILHPVVGAKRTRYGALECEGGGEDACVPAACPSGRCAAGGCAPGGAGVACAVPTDCLSNACVDGSCGLGAEDAPCLQASDCDPALGLACVGDVCSAQ